MTGKNADKKLRKREGDFYITGALTAVSGLFFDSGLNFLASRTAYQRDRLEYLLNLDYNNLKSVK